MAAVVVYNEETFIEEAIKNLFKIWDLDSIEILDGAWEQGGRSPISTDRTKEIVSKLANTSHIPINFTENQDFWESEPVKRNWQLQQIEKKYGSDTWVFWFDGDEEIHFHTGITNIKLRPILCNKKTPGIVNTFGFGFSIPYPGPRFIKLGQGLHFYSEMANHLHDANCKTIMNWAIYKQVQPCWFMPDFFIVNHWMYRNGIRIEDKINYYKFQCEEFERTKNYPACKYNNSIITRAITNQ